MYFASQSINDSPQQSKFQTYTKWVPRMYLSFIVIGMDGINAELHFYILLLGTCMIGEQIIVRILAGKMQADSYPEEAY